MFILRQTSVKMAVLLHKQAKVPFIVMIAVYVMEIITYKRFHDVCCRITNYDKLMNHIGPSEVFMKNLRVFRCAFGKEATAC